MIPIQGRCYLVDRQSFDLRAGRPRCTERGGARVSYAASQLMLTRSRHTSRKHNELAFGQRVRVPRVRLENTMVDVDRPALVSVPEAARMLGISRASAYRYADAGLLPGVRRLGRRVYVVRARLVEFLEPEQDVAGEAEAA